LTLRKTWIGKKRKKLKTKGKAGVTPTVTFTPTGGTAKTQSTSFALKRKRPK
jgi:hypothetical protein